MSEKILRVLPGDRVVPVHNIIAFYTEYGPDEYHVGGVYVFPDHELTDLAKKFGPALVISCDPERHGKSQKIFLFFANKFGWGWSRNWIARNP